MAALVPIIVFGLTLYLSLFKPRHLIGWMCLILCVDIFDSQVFVNLSSVKSASLALALTSFKVPWLRLFKQSKFLQAFSAYAGFLCLLGLYFGYLSPGEFNLTRHLPKDAPHWRVPLHLISFFLEAHFAFRLGHGLNQAGHEALDWVRKGFFIGFALVCAGAFLEKMLGFDFYHFFTGGRAFLDPLRMRGFSYEPRGLSQACAYGLLLLPLMLQRWWQRLAAGLLLFVSGFVLSSSMTGAVTLVGGAVALFSTYQLLNQANLKVFLKAFVGLVGIITVLIGITFMSSAWIAAENHYLNRLYVFSPNTDFISRLEVFDAAAANFFKHHPERIVVGTGPGLVYLSASDYVMEKDASFWNNGFSALPHMGAILVISNCGVVGFALFLLTLWLGVINAREKGVWACAYYVTFAFLYMLQIRPFFALALALAFPSDRDRSA